MVAVRISCIACGCVVAKEVWRNSTFFDRLNQCMAGSLGMFSIARELYAQVRICVILVICASLFGIT